MADNCDGHTVFPPTNFLIQASGSIAKIRNRSEGHTSFAATEHRTSKSESIAKVCNRSNWTVFSAAYRSPHFRFNIAS